MTRLKSVVLLAGITSALLAVAQQVTPTVNQVSIQQTSIVSGQQMYTTYCATCHGSTGIGNGPAATATKIPPTDLTMLSKSNGGVFPANHVVSVLQFGTENPAHGSVDMPVWGDLMLSLHKGSSNPDVLVQQRITNLTGYLKQIQK